MDLWYMITYPFALMINGIYFVVQNYGVAIILFTIVVKAALWPLTAKQQKSTMEMQKIQPQLKALQEKYKNDKEKLNQETMNLYKEHSINPMAGCLPMLIQLPLIIAVYQVISRPLTYMMNMTFEQIDNMKKLIWEFDGGEAIAQLAGSVEAVSAYLFRMQDIDVLHFFNKNNMQLPEGITSINFWFCGLDLSQTPMNVLGDWMTNFIWIIPVISLATAYWSSKTMSGSGAATNADPNAAQTQKTMMMMMPLMSGYFTLILPAGVGLYWIVSNLAQVAQQYIINKKKAQASDVIDVTPNKKSKKK